MTSTRFSFSLIDMDDDTNAERWHAALARPLGFDEPQYHKARSQAEQLRERLEFDWNGELRRARRALCADLDTIAADVPRTFSEKQASGALDAANLDALLGALAVSSAADAELLDCRELGYTQGMNYIAAFLLLNQMEAWRAFGCVRALQRRPFSRILMSLEAEAWSALSLAFALHLDEALPQLGAHLKRVGLEPEMFLSEWMVPLFTRSLSLDAAAAVWDLYVREGEAILLRVASALARALEPTLLSSTDLAFCRSVMSQEPQRVDTQQAAAATFAQTSRDAATCAASEPPPHKFLLEGNTPSSDQKNRGDCWLFSVSGILEDSYRRFGVDKGYFDGKSYLRLSRQALGIQVMDICRSHPNGLCPAEMAGGKLLWANTTEGHDGADEHLLYHLRTLGRLGASGAVADSVCPYSPVPDPVLERECPDLSQEQAHNPLSFEVTASRDYFGHENIKRALLREQRPLTLGLTMTFVPFYFPHKPPDAVSDECVPCPLERIYRHVDCCYLVNKPMVSMKGEWLARTDEPMQVEGGHAVNIVGYNDAYLTEFGEVGGFIIRNTWADGLGTAHGLKARGSHTAAYFAHELSDASEALNCPNPHSPRSWMPCESKENCESMLMQVEAEAMGKVLRLKCIDLGFALAKGSCITDASYYFVNKTEWGASGLFVHCFISVPADGSDAGSVCLPPLTTDDVATVFSFADESQPVNDIERCGFNFMPYSVYEAMSMRFGGVVASAYDISWAPHSYVSHAEKRFNYSHVRTSTRPLKELLHFTPKLYSP